MNGARTGGEGLPALEAGSTGRPVNGAGVAALLSRNKLAGSVIGTARCGGGSSKRENKLRRKKAEHIAAAVAKNLSAHSWAAVDNFAPRETIGAIRNEVRVMEGNYDAGEVWVGHNNEVGAQIKQRDVRGDKVLWLGTEALSATAFVKDGKRTKCKFHTLRSLVHTIDQFVQVVLAKKVCDLANVKERSDAMMAIYPGGGARFARHIDNTAGDGRRLTVLCYLNPSWTPDQGGALRLWPPDGSNPIDVFPYCGRLALFYSKTVPHGVQRTMSIRHSVTLWYYDSAERAESIAKAAMATAGMSRASQADQRAACDFVEAAMTCDKENVSANISQLTTWAARMPDAALEIVGKVLGIGGAPDCRMQLSKLDESTLHTLQQQLACMGMQHRPGA